MSITVVYSTIFNFLGLELLVVDLGHLRRFGVQPLSIAELLLSCAATSSRSSILTTIFFVVMCYTVRSIVTRLYVSTTSPAASFSLTVIYRLHARPSKLLSSTPKAHTPTTSAALSHSDAKSGTISSRPIRRSRRQSLPRTSSATALAGRS